MCRRYAPSTTEPRPFDRGSVWWIARGGGLAIVTRKRRVDHRINWKSGELLVVPWPLGNGTPSASYGWPEPGVVMEPGRDVWCTGKARGVDLAGHPPPKRSELRPPRERSRRTFSKGHAWVFSLIGSSCKITNEFSRISGSGAAPSPQVLARVHCLAPRADRPFPRLLVSGKNRKTPFHNPKDPWIAWKPCPSPWRSPKGSLTARRGARRRRSPPRAARCPS